MAAPPKFATSRREVPWLTGQRLTKLFLKLLPAAMIFAGAASLDLVTKQQQSHLIGSVAIILSFLFTFPRMRPAFVAAAVYGSIWLGFNAGRAVADNAKPAIGSADAVMRAEFWLLSGTLPSRYLQLWLRQTGLERPLDILMTCVHLSFFVTPFLVAVLLWKSRRPDFWRYNVATASCFGFGLLGFLLLPTAPPWLVQPETVTRVTEQILPLSFTAVPAGNGSKQGADSALVFETNHIAAMPSMHVAIAVLIALAMTRISQRFAFIGYGYAVLMSFSVVYLGEHFLLDVLGGWLAAFAGWWLTVVWFARRSSSTRFQPSASSESIGTTRGTR